MRLKNEQKLVKDMKIQNALRIEDNGQDGRLRTEA